VVTSDEAIPHGPTGKVRKVALREHLAASDPTRKVGVS
jgi:hypothetical protein